MRRAKRGYDREGIRGSDDKDVFGAEVFTVAGAECDSSPSGVREGLLSVAVPAKKRLALSLVSLRAASLRWISEELASQLSGGWVSALMFRRCAMALANEVFSLGVSGFTGDFGSRLVPLRPAVRQELVLLAVFAPVLAANVSVPYCQQVFASDASLEKGAYIASVSAPVAASLWLSADNKGFYTRLDEPWRAALSAVGLEPLAAPESPAFPQNPQPKKPVGQRFDFLLAGPAPLKLQAALSGLGLVGGPILDASSSKHLDLCDPDALEWAMHLLSTGRLASLALFVPSGALSVLRLGRRGAVSRSSRAARASRGLCTLFWCAWRNCVPVLLVCGGLSSFCSSPRLAYVKGLAGVVSHRLPLCSGRACHKGSALVLTSGLDLAPKNPRASCTLGFSREPPPAKESLGCCPSFLERLVASLSSCLLARPAAQAPKSGLESLVVNDLLASGCWKAGPAWRWGETEHINVLEARAYLKVLRDLSCEGGDLRYTHIVDSAVALGAASKGRSSTRALRKILFQSAALQISSGLYPSVAYGPTRLNVADDPTRNVSLRAPCELSVLGALRPGDLYLACGFKQLRRPTANWLRLACLLVGFRSPRPLGGFLRALGSPGRSERSPSRGPHSFSEGCPEPLLPFPSFDATLGYPGEGPGPLGFCPQVGGHRSFLRCAGVSFGLGQKLWCAVRGDEGGPTHGLCTVLLSHLLFRPPSWPLGPFPFRFGSRPFASSQTSPLSTEGLRLPLLPLPSFDSTLGYPGEGPVPPRHHRDAERGEARAASELPTGRPVLPRTRSNRAALLQAFDSWLRQQSSSLDILERPPLDAAAIGRTLATYGRELFEGGRPYWHFSETVNAVSARMPSVRRQLQEPWDLAFSWLALEPYTHHVPMPLVLLLATLSVCLLWGWVREAGVFALAWGGLLRIGEAVNARRTDLILPQDVLGMQQFILLRIQEPKTRLRMARHQAAKVEPEDLVRTITMAFGSAAPGEKLWPRSSQTLRRRLDSVLERLGVIARDGERAIDLGSFRPGGATHLLQISEDSELVRRRGRWASHRVMEIYLQEIQAIVFLPNQPEPVRRRIVYFAQAFPVLLEKAEQWTEQQLPPAAWFALFSTCS